MRHLLSIGAALFAPAALAQTDGERPAHIQVAGTARVETKPDRARMSYTVTGEGRTADDASAALAAKHKAIVDGLSTLLGRATELTAGNVTVGQVRPPQCQGNDYGRPQLSEGACAVIGYTATLQGSVATAAVDRIGTAVGLAARLGARNAQVQGFELADPAAARRRATSAAILDARARAETMATGAGVRLGELLTLGDQNNGGDVVVTAQDIGYLGGPPAPPAPPAPVVIDVKPRPIETRATVYARFAIQR